MCEHEPFSLPHDAFNQEESAGVQLLDTERPLVYCCFCRKLLLPGRWPLLLSCLHSCCRECAIQRTKGVSVGNEAGGGSSSSASAVASAAALAESADAVRRQVADYLAMLRDSVLVRRRLRCAASAMFADMPQCDACSSDAGSGATTSAKDNTAYERCDACSLNLCYDCRQWHDKFNSRHEIITLGTSDSDASPLSRDMRPQCMHHAAALAVHRTSAATAADVFCASCKRFRCADCLILCVTKTHELPCLGETEDEVPLCNACCVNQAMPATAKPRIAWCNACCKSLCDSCFRMHQLFTSGHPVRVVGKQILNLGHLADNARLAFDGRLKHLECLDALNLPDIAMKLRQQARDSFKQAEDALARQKNVVLQELERVRDDVDDLARNIEEIESQLQPAMALTQSYLNMLLSSASDDACVLDQNAVVLSRLDSILCLADNAKDLLDKAGAVLKDGSRRKPVDLIEKMIERLQELQKQLQQEQQPGQDDHDTADGSNIILSADDGKGESDSDNSGNQGGDCRQVEGGGDNTGNGRDDSHKDEDGGDSKVDTSGVGSKGEVDAVTSGDRGGDDSSGEGRGGSTGDGRTDGRKGDDSYDILSGDGVNGESDGVNSRNEKRDGSKVEGGERNKGSGRDDNHKDESGRDSKVVARGIGSKGEGGVSSCDRGGDDSSGERRDGNSGGGGGDGRKGTEKEVRAEALFRGFQRNRSRFVNELDESSVCRITDYLLEAQDGFGLISHEQCQLIQRETTDEKKARKLHDTILKCGCRDEAIELVAKVLMSADIGKADLAKRILNHN